MTLPFPVADSNVAVPANDISSGTGGRCALTVLLAACPWNFLVVLRINILSEGGTIKFTRHFSNAVFRCCCNGRHLLHIKEMRGIYFVLKKLSAFL